MRELKVISKDGIFKDADIRAGILEQGDCTSADDKGISRGEFFDVLDKASQPIKHEAKSDQEQSQT